MDEPLFSIGQTVIADHRGEKISGRFVGVDNGENRYRMPRTWLYLVKPTTPCDGFVEVAEAAVQAAPR